MKRLAILFALVAVTTGAHAQTCVIPYEWCQLGCNDIGGYSIRSFVSLSDATAFTSTLNGIQQETVRITVFPSYSSHIVVAYRVLATERPSGTAPVGISCSPSMAVMHAYPSIETAEVELNQIPLAQRSGAAVLPATTIPGDSYTRALLIYLVNTSTTGGVQEPRVMTPSAK